MDADTTAERPVAMRGDVTFFDGQLRAEATVSRGRAIAFTGTHEGAGGGGRAHGGGGMGRHHRGGGESAPLSGDDSDSGARPMRGAGGSVPPVTLRLRLENTSKAPIDVQIRDVKSDLGDFAVRPERLLLAPDQAAEVDPMVSELGVTSDEIPVTLVLRAGGKTETENLVLKNLFTPAQQENK